MFWCIHSNWRLNSSTRNTTLSIRSSRTCFFAEERETSKLWFYHSFPALSSLRTGNKTKCYPYFSEVGQRQFQLILNCIRSLLTTAPGWLVYRVQYYIYQYYVYIHVGVTLHAQVGLRCRESLQDSSVPLLWLVTPQVVSTSIQTHARLVPGSRSQTPSRSTMLTSDASDH